MRRRILTSGLLNACLKWTVLVFALWTLAYQLVLATRWPAYISIVVFAAELVVTVALVVILRRKPAAQESEDEKDPCGVIAGLLALSLVCAVLSLVFSRPDWDDVGFYHRPLVQSYSLQEPFILGDTVHNHPGLPGPTSMHLMASYEMLVAFAARLAGLDSVSLYHNASCAIASFLLPIVYYLLMRRLLLKPLEALVGAVAVCAFLWTDGNRHAALGNLAFIRLWQGKWILLSVLVPYAVLVVLEYWRRPTARNWGLIFACGIAAVGLSGTGLVILPVIVFIVSVALLVSSLREKSDRASVLLTRAALASAAGAYCVVLAAGVKSGVIPTLREMSGSPVAIGRSDTWSWWRNLSVTLGEGWSPLWYGALLAFAPLVALAGQARRFAYLWTLAAIALCFNGLTGPLWLKAMLAVYYRLIFVLPITLCAGLAAVGAWSLPRSDWGRVRTWSKAAVVAVLVLLFQQHFERTTYAKDNRTTLKSPFEYRFEKKVLQFSRSVSVLLDGRSLLAPDEVTVVLPLVIPSARLEIMRWWVTVSYFHDVGDTAEGIRRMKAQQVVVGKSNVHEPMFDARTINTFWPDTENLTPEEAFMISARNTIDAIVVRNGRAPIVMELLESSEDRWEQAYQDETFTLLLRQADDWSPTLGDTAR